MLRPRSPGAPGCSRSTTWSSRPLWPQQSPLWPLGAAGVVVDGIAGVGAKLFTKSLSEKRK